METVVEARDGLQITPAPLQVSQAKSAPRRSRKPVRKTSSNARKPHSGSGSNLPAVAGLDWERNSSGGWEAWHVPPGAFHRKDKTYLGYAGKKLLASWEGLDPDAAEKAAEAWAEQKRARKGIQKP